MIIIGLLVLVATMAFGVDLVWKNDVHIANPTVFGEKLGIHSAASLFVVGVITGAALVVGVTVLVWGVRRKGASVVSRRHERQETRRLREERDRLRVERAASPVAPSEAPPAEPSRPDDAMAAPPAPAAPVEDRTEPVDAGQPQDA